MILIESFYLPNSIDTSISYILRMSDRVADLHSSFILSKVTLYLSSTITLTDYLFPTNLHKLDRSDNTRDASLTHSLSRPLTELIRMNPRIDSSISRFAQGPNPAQPQKATSQLRHKHDHPGTEQRRVDGWTDGWNGTITN